MSRHRLLTRITVGVVALIATSFGAAAAAHAAPASPDIPISAVGRGSAAAARTVDVAHLPQQPTKPARPATATTQRHEPGATLPSRPTAGHRPNAGGLVTPAAASVVASFDGATGNNCSSCAQPSDVNAAVGRTMIAEATNENVDVFTKTGGAVCHFSYASLLGTSDALTDPRIVYDNIFGRFVTVIIVEPASSTATPAIWLAVTTAESPCGSWYTFRITLGSAVTPGDTLDYPFLALDVHSILISTNKIGASALWAIPKLLPYNGNGFSFPVFTADLYTVPVTIGGIPMRSTANTYFLESVPGTGYKLYRMDNSAGPNTSFTLQATISSPFNGPSREANQPRTSVTLETMGGNLTWSPVLSANNDIWFAHGMDDSGFPTIRYGAVNVFTNTVRVAEAYHDGISDDFNPSISVGGNPGGTSTVFLNWAFTDSTNNIATSDTVNSLVPGTGALPNLVGTDSVLVFGSITSQTRFGDNSSVAIDPSVSAGTCAVTAQQYFGVDWNTRIARVGSC